MGPPTSLVSCWASDFTFETNFLLDGKSNSVLQFFLDVIRLSKDLAAMGGTNVDSRAPPEGVGFTLLAKKQPGFCTFH